MRRLIALLAVCASVLTGCGPFQAENPMETSLPSHLAGFRVVGDELRMWTGAPCEGVTEVNVRFSSPGTERDELHLFSPTDDERLTPGVRVDHLALDGPHPGLLVAEPLPEGFDWRAAERFSLNLGGPPVSRGPLELDFPPIVAEITEHSAEHPEDTYFFPGLGWLGPAEVAAGDGKDFLTMCTPDPAKVEAEERTVGVRVTGDTLRFWTGAPCAFDAGVILTFQPGQAELILRKDRPRTDVEFVALGAPDPEFRVTHPLPDGFDWRTARSVLFRIIDTDGLLWSRTTDLAVPVAESSEHPPDTYYFEGAGWLGPAQLAAQDGTSMRTICNDRR